MSVLTIVQNASVAVGLASPAAVVGVANQSQMLALLNMEGEDLRSRGQWFLLRRTNTFNLITSSTNQGAMNSTIVTAGDYDYMWGQNFWNLTRKQQIYGPLSDTEEEALIAIGIAGPYQKWTIRGGNLYIYAQPGSTDSCTFQYMSKFYAKSAALALKSAFTVDTDLGVLDESIMTLGLIWRWKRANGLDYSQEFSIYEKRVQDALGREMGGKSLHMDMPNYPAFGIVISPGNWPL